MVALKVQENWWRYFMKTSIKVWRMFPFATCQLETAQFITTGDICTWDLWFIPDIGIYTHGERKAGIWYWKRFRPKKAQ
jgi:hypothetical protein